jgi:thiamine transport system permease protein
VEHGGAALTVLVPAALRPRGGAARRASRAPAGAPVPAWVLGVVPVSFLVVFFAWPVLTVLARGLSTDGLSLLGTPELWQVLEFTVFQAVLSTVLTLAVALPCAYVTSRYAFRGRRLLVVVVTVPFVLPTVVVGLAFRALLPAAWIGTLGAILVAHVFFNYAVVVRVVGGLWGQLDPRYVQAARTLGASPARAFRTVTWPLLRPAVVAAAVLVFLFTFTSFGVVLVLGGPSTTTLEVEVYRRTAELLDLPGAAVLAVLQMALLGVVLFVAARVQARSAVRLSLRAPDGGALIRPERAGERALLAGVVASVVVLLVLPLAALVLRSCRVRDGWGLDWWRALGSLDAGTTRYASPGASIRVSLGYAGATAVLSVVIGGLAACAIAYARRGGRALDAAAMLPLGTSAVTVGFGLLLAFGRPPLDLRESWVMVPLAHTLIAVPLVLRTVLPVLRSVDPRLRQVAATLGARPGRAWASVDLPLLARALAVAAGFAFAVSLGEFGATSFLSRSDAPTLPVQVVRLLSRPGEESFGAAMALATVLMVVTTAVLLVAEALQPAVRRVGR